ncbi:MAG: DUF3102 domain-containing protein [Oscillospiraceae bacterium]|nr:DUF3102 domain-containing protein [Oscillospiraceae bacterium]
MTNGSVALKRQLKAQSLHRTILANGQIAAEAMVELAKNLKEMRDTKLYKELGYDKFEAYCEEAAHIKQRQAYNFIKALDEFGQEGLQANANLGITKLTALAALCSDDREQLMATVDVEAVSTRELEEKIAELKKKCEQLSLDLDAANKADDALEQLTEEKQELESKLTDLQEENEKLKNRPVEVAVAEPSEKQLEEIRKKVEAEVKADGDKRVKKALEGQLSAEKRAQELEEQVKVLQSTAQKSAPPSERRELLKFHFSNIETAFNAAADIIRAMDDGEEKEKFRAAMRTFVDKCVNAVVGV